MPVHETSALGGLYTDISHVGCAYNQHSRSRVYVQQTSQISGASTADTRDARPQYTWQLRSQVSVH